MRVKHAKNIFGEENFYFILSARKVYASEKKQYICIRKYRKSK